MATKEKAKESVKKETKKSAAAQSTKTTTKKSSRQGAAKYIAAIIIIVAIIGAAIFANYYFVGNHNNGDFTVFQSNFNSAPRVTIMVAGYNGTVLSSTIGCATSVIEQIVASKTNHRDPSTIDLSIINQTSCVLSTGLQGKTNYTVTSLQNCINYTKTEPTIFINYSTTNSTIIHPDYLSITGDQLYLSECGVASEIS